MGRKHCGKRRNCSLRAVSPFPTVFSKDLYCRHVKTRAGLGKGYNGLMVPSHIENSPIANCFDPGHCLHFVQADTINTSCRCLIPLFHRTELLC